MSTKISLSFLAVVGSLIGAETMPAKAVISNIQSLEINNTSDDLAFDVNNYTDPMIVNDRINPAQNSHLSIGSIPNLPRTNGLDNSLDRGEKNHFQTENIIEKTDSNLLNQNHNLSTPTGVVKIPVNQIDVFSSDVTGLEPKLIANLPSAQPERSIPILVPPPRTQTIAPPVNSNTTPKLRTGSPMVSPSPSTAFTNIPPTEFSSTSISIYPLLTPAPITSRFGWRTHPLTGNRRFHSGIDIAAPMGAPVVATGSGTIVSAGWNGGYGKAIVIQHNGIHQTLYGHLSEISVQVGQTVTPGTVIGLVGSTGNSTGPHLHFESRTLTGNTWTAIDPIEEIKYAMDYLKRSTPFVQRDLPRGI
jgi:murein DD-endopeptidase MepM/ murein hydrolase activator NlpD